MPVHVAKRGNKYCVVDPEGKLTGKCYSSKEDAVAQVQAINLSMRRQEGKAVSKGGVELLVEKNFKLDTQAAEVAPAIMIESDGSPEGTKLYIHGQVVNVDNLYFNCYKGEYGSCNLEICIRDTDANGMEIKRSLTLRKESPPKDVAIKAQEGGAK